MLLLADFQLSQPRPRRTRLLSSRYTEAAEPAFQPRRQLLAAPPSQTGAELSQPPHYQYSRQFSSSAINREIAAAAFQLSAPRRAAIFDTVFIRCQPQPAGFSPVFAFIATPLMIEARLLTLNITIIDRADRDSFFDSFFFRLFYLLPIFRGLSSLLSR